MGVYTTLEIEPKQEEPRKILEDFVAENELDLYLMALNITKDPKRAEDLAQDTFLRAFNNIDSYKPGKAKFTTWLFRVMRNYYINCCKEDNKKGKAVSLDDDDFFYIPAIDMGYENRDRFTLDEFLENPLPFTQELADVCDQGLGQGLLRLHEKYPKKLVVFVLKGLFNMNYKEIKAHKKYPRRKLFSDIKGMTERTLESRYMDAKLYLIERMTEYNRLEFHMNRVNLD